MYFHQNHSQVDMPVTSEQHNNHFSGISYAIYMGFALLVPPAGALPLCLSGCLSVGLSTLYGLGLWLSSKNNSAHSVRKIMDVRPGLIS